jgi:hypothetical protein
VQAKPKSEGSANRRILLTFQVSGGRATGFADGLNFSRWPKFNVISTPTTFVVGAGASVPYGLPTGPALCETARALSPNAAGYQVVREAGITTDALDEFLRDLKQYPGESIDAFLGHRTQQPQVSKVGRTVIAALMGQAVLNTRGTLTHPKRDWLRCLVLQMTAGAPRFDDFIAGNTAVNFVTFNFDTIIEDRLARLVTDVYGGGHVPTDLPNQLSQACPIVHVHGQLPQAPDGPMDLGEVHGYSSEWVKWTRETAAQIHVVQDEIHASIVAEARSSVNRAQVLCFMGFAYAVENLQRLGIGVGQEVNNPRQVYGTGFDLRQGRREWVCRQVRDLHLLAAGTDCMGLLVDTPVFRD